MVEHPHSVMEEHNILGKAGGKPTPFPVELHSTILCLVHNLDLVEGLWDECLHLLVLQGQKSTERTGDCEFWLIYNSQNTL